MFSANFNLIQMSIFHDFFPSFQFNVLFQSLHVPMVNVSHPLINVMGIMTVGIIPMKETVQVKFQYWPGCPNPKTEILYHQKFLGYLDWAFNLPALYYVSICFQGAQPPRSPPPPPTPKVKFHLILQNSNISTICCKYFGLKQLSV